MKSIRRKSILTKKSILIVGSEGYIGNVVTYNLLKHGYAVTSFDNLIYDNHLCVLNKTHIENYRFVYGDMLDTNILTPLIKDADAIILLAGLVGDPITKKFPEESAKIKD